MRRLFLTLAVLLLTTATATADLTVFAASSLREAFTELGATYEQSHGKPVAFNFAGSQILRTQIEHGAPADLYAAADLDDIKSLSDQKLAGNIHFFAENRLIVLLSKKETPIRRIADLAASGVQIALGNRAVPIGQYTRQLFTNLAENPDFGPELVQAIQSNVRSEESSVKAIVTKLLLDEVDAGIVYRSDLTPDVRTRTAHIDLPEPHNPTARYPATLIRNSHNPEEAERFLQLMLSPVGQEIFRRHGFLPLHGRDV